MDEDERILEDGEGGEGPQLRWLERRSRESCGEKVLQTIREAVLSVLYGGEPVPGREHCDWEWDWAKNAHGTITGTCCNAIATVRIEVTAAVDDTGKEIRIPHDANPREWYIDKPDMAHRIYFLAFSFEDPMLTMSRTDVDMMLILTHVGSIECRPGHGKDIGCIENNIGMCKFGGAELDELDDTRRYLSPDMRLAIKKQGWS